MSDVAVASSQRLGVTAAIFLGSAFPGLFLWLGILTLEWPRLMASGTICGEANGFFGHCLACYPAVALTGIALFSGLEWLLARDAEPLDRVQRS